MKNKILNSILICVSFYIVGCSSPSDGDTLSSTNVSTSTNSAEYSAAKKKYVESCVEVSSSTESFCSCQYDALDPLLSKSIGENWSSKSMEEKDFPIYMAAVEEAVPQCI